MQQASITFCVPRMLTSSPIQGSRSMVIDISGGQVQHAVHALGRPRSAAAAASRRPAPVLRRSSPCRCLMLSAEPWKKLSRIVTSAAPSRSNSSAVAEPTRLAPPTIRKRLPLIGSEWDFAARGDVELVVSRSRSNGRGADRQCRPSYRQGARGTCVDIARKSDAVIRSRAGISGTQSGAETSRPATVCSAARWSPG